MVKFYILQGSGWGWLGYNKAAGKLQIAACPNQVNFYTVFDIIPIDPENLLSFHIQDPLEATTGLVPLFGIDVWEHAYYLQVLIILIFLKLYFTHSSSLMNAYFLCFSTRMSDLTM